MTQDLICASCKHFDFINGGCAAFPGGIPMEITDLGNQHDKPLTGQKNDLVYEKGDPEQFEIK